MLLKLRIEDEVKENSPLQTNAQNNDDNELTGILDVCCPNHFLVELWGCPLNEVSSEMESVAEFRHDSPANLSDDFVQIHWRITGQSWQSATA